MLNSYSFEYLSFDSDQELSNEDKDLLNKARTVCKNAYAPYSNFLVGAAAYTVNKDIITGTNQENISHGATICAERTLLSAWSSIMDKSNHITTLAISYHAPKCDKPIFPCGICRQSLLEHQCRTNSKMKIILGGSSGQVIVLPDALCLLPFAFSSNVIGQYC